MKVEKINRIVQINDPKNGPVLRRIADEINLKTFSRSKIETLLKEMVTALKTQKDGVALAAPQINISSRLFIISPSVFQNIDLKTVKLKGTTKFETVFINPKIIRMSKDKKKMDEGCLSVRPWYGKVKRASRTCVSATNENGVEFEMEGTGLLSQIFQHEIDHLDGILFTDKATNLRKLENE